MDPFKAPIAITDIAKKAPEWPFSIWTTWRYARQGRLKTIRIGRRVFVTHELLEQFLTSHTATTEGKAA